MHRNPQTTFEHNYARRQNDLQDVSMHLHVKCPGIEQAACVHTATGRTRGSWERGHISYYSAQLSYLYCNALLMFWVELDSRHDDVILHKWWLVIYNVLTNFWNTVSPFIVCIKPVQFEFNCPHPTGSWMDGQELEFTELQFYR